MNFGPHFFEGIVALHDRQDVSLEPTSESHTRRSSLRLATSSCSWMACDVWIKVFTKAFSSSFLNMMSNTVTP